MSARTVQANLVKAAQELRRQIAIASDTPHLGPTKTEELVNRQLLPVGYKLVEIQNE